MKNFISVVRAKNSDNPRSEVTFMRKKFQQVGLVAFGAALGVAASLHFSAVADRQVSAPLQNKPSSHSGLDVQPPPPRDSNELMTSMRPQP